MATRRNTVSQRVRTHREKLRAAGLRPIQLWVPDTRTPTFLRAALLQSERIAASEHERDDQAFVDSISEFRS